MNVPTMKKDVFIKTDEAPANMVAGAGTTTITDTGAPRARNLERAAAGLVVVGRVWCCACGRSFCICRICGIIVASW